MRISPMPQVCSVVLCAFLVLITGCSNPSSQNLASLTVTATPSTVSVGGSSVLKAVAHLTDGTTQDVTSSTQWTISNPALATMKNGSLTAVAAGAVTVQAAYVEAAPAGASPASASTTAENLNASTQVTITSAPSTPSQSTPTISWSAPAAIAYGTALSSTQLNATANVPGTFVYTPAAGIVLKAGTQTLSVVFTPTDSSTYSSATATVQLTVNSPSQSTPTISWSAPAAIAYGTALNSTQLNATANVPGTFVYTPAAGAVLKAGTQRLSVVFTPTDSSTYPSATATVQLTVNQATPTITWAPLAAITQGTALGAAQLDATANVPGAFVYNPAAGNVPAAGTLQLTAAFTPTDTSDYTSATAKNSLVVSSPSSGPLHAPASICTTLSSGASQSTIQSALNSCGSGNTVAFSTGTYGPITSTITIPCGVSMTGPVVPYSQTPNQTATINGSSFNGSGFQSSTGCSATTTIQYLVWNGHLPSNGGGFIELNAGTTNYVIQNNWLYGANVAAVGSQSPNAGQIYICCLGTGGAVNNNITIEWNVFGSSSMSDCNTVMNDNSSPEADDGGYCLGVGMGGNETNVTVEFNIFRFLEQGTKTYEGPCCEANPVYLQFNDYNNIHRNGNENQVNYGASLPTLMYIDYNSWHDHFTGTTFVGYESSSANGCQNPSNQNPTNCVTHTDYNVFYETHPGVYTNAIEQWGGAGTTASYNLFQGNIPDGIQYSTNGQFTDNNNTYQSSDFGSNPVACNPPNSNGLFNSEQNPNQAYIPVCTGNTTSTTISTVTSATPSLSPASGSFSGSQVVTIANGGGTALYGSNRDANTTVWCTTDGSTPTPGSGTAVGYWQGGSLTVKTTTTVKCVGMWGALNQPYSYPSGYGYVPSSVVTATYTAASSVVKQPGAKISSVSGTDTVAPTEAAGNGASAGAELASVAIAPVQATVAVGSTTQLKAIATLSDGSTRDVTTDFAWTSSDTRTITATSSGLLAGLATGKATITGTYRGLQASVPAVSTIGQVDWSGPIVITGAGTYSGNWESTDTRTPAVTVATTAPVVIENAHISSVAGLIKTSVAGANLTVRNSVGLAVNPAVKGQSNGVFLDASSPARLDVENNYVENAGGGVLVHGYSGNRDGQQTIVIRANRARNLNGLLSDGKDGYLPPVGSSRSISRFIELDEVQAVPGIEVGWNEVINYPGRSLVADNIAIKSSSGTPNQPIEIHDTYIQGAYPYTAAQADYAGGGIKTEGGPYDSAQQAPAFTSIHDNQVVGTVNYGIEFTAGHDNIAANNRVISSGLLADGTRIAAQHVGMANGDVNGANNSMYNNTMHDNLIGWACWTSSCSQSGYRKDQFFPASPQDYSTNSVLTPQPISPETENNEYQIWLNKTASGGIVVGPTF